MVCKMAQKAAVLQLEATFIEVKNMYLHQDSNPGLWNTIINTIIKTRAIDRLSLS